MSEVREKALWRVPGMDEREVCVCVRERESEGEGACV